MYHSYPCQWPPIRTYLKFSAISTIKLSGFSACPWVSAKIQVMVADPVVTTSSVLIWVAFIYYHSYHSGHRDPACPVHYTDATCALWSLWLLGKSTLSLNSALCIEFFSPLFPVWYLGFIIGINLFGILGGIKLLSIHLCSVLLKVLFVIRGRLREQRQRGHEPIV